MFLKDPGGEVGAEVVHMDANMDADNAEGCHNVS